MVATRGPLARIGGLVSLAFAAFFLLLLSGEKLKGIVNKWNKDDVGAAATEEASALAPCIPAACTAPLHVSTRPLQRVALQSLPGSGNTWMRHLLQQGSRIYTLSIYCDRKLEASGFPKECWASGKSPVRFDFGVATKTHYPLLDKKHITMNILKPRGAIVVIRSPFDSILSDFQRFLNGGEHTAAVRANVFKTERWKSWVMTATSRWNKGANAHRNNDIGADRTLVVYYEELKRNLPQELGRIFSFLRNEMGMDSLPSAQDAVICALLSSQGNNHRKKKQGFSNPYHLYPQLVRHICDTTRDWWNENMWGPCDGTLQNEREMKPAIYAVPKERCER